MGKIKIEAVAISNKGNLRKTNQDHFFLNGSNQVQLRLENDECSAAFKDSFQMYGVFDGLGGESYGEQAALLGAQMAEYYKQQLTGKILVPVEKYINMYFQDTNKKICQMIKEKKVKASGTTAAVAWLYKNNIYCANIGDTRIYLHRNNKLQQLSLDHTQQMLYEKLQCEKGQVTSEAGRHQLTQYIGIEPSEMMIEPYLFNIAPEKNDIIVICSDGVSEKLEDDQMGQILTKNKSLEKAGTLFINEAIKHGSRDNMTVMLLRIRKTLL